MLISGSILTTARRLKREGYSLDYRRKWFAAVRYLLERDLWMRVPRSIPPHTRIKP